MAGVKLGIAGAGAARRLPRREAAPAPGLCREDKVAKLAGVAERRERSPGGVDRHRSHLQGLGADGLDGLDAGSREGGRVQIVVRGGRRVFGTRQRRLLLPQPRFDVTPRKAPLAAHLEARQPAVAEHAVDGDAIDVQQGLELPGCEQIVHDPPCPLIGWPQFTRGSGSCQISQDVM
jgi:hypothetical protein